MMKPSNPEFKEFITASAALLDAMANEKRLELLSIITVSETSVGKLSDMVHLSQSALSQQLGKLRQANLVKTRRVAQTVYYSCDSVPIKRILALLFELAEPPEVIPSAKSA